MLREERCNAYKRDLRVDCVYLVKKLALFLLLLDNISFGLIVGHHNF